MKSTGATQYREVKNIKAMIAKLQKPTKKTLKQKYG